MSKVIRWNRKKEKDPPEDHGPAFCSLIMGLCPEKECEDMKYCTTTCELGKTAAEYIKRSRDLEGGIRK